MPLILDMKALPADPQATAVAHVLTQERAWPRVVIYLFNANRLPAQFRGLSSGAGFRVARRDAFAIAARRAGYGLYRRSGCIELGRFPAQSDGVSIVAIAVNNAADYRVAACLGLDAVHLDSPHEMARVRAGLAQSPSCPGPSGITGTKMMSPKTPT